MTTTTCGTDRTAAAILARRQHAASLLRNVEDALRKLRRDRARLTFRGVAARAGFSELKAIIDIDHLMAVSRTHGEQL